MKLLKYRVADVLIAKYEDGTKKEEVFLRNHERYSDEANFEKNYAIAQREAYNGEVTVEDIPDPPHNPTEQERITALEDQMALADETAIELFEAQMEQEEINTAQDDALIEIYEMIGGI